MDLVKLITAKVQEIESTGKLDKIIEKHVLNCLESVVKDSFQWQGEAKKQIEAALKGKLGISLENVNIPQYQKMVSDIVNKQLNETIVSDLQTDIERVVNDITEVLEKKEWKLSEIIEAFIEGLDTSYDGEMESQYGECSLHVKSDRSFTHIYFDKESDKESYECGNRLFMYKGELSSAIVDNKPFSPFQTRVLGSFEKFMFKLYCNNVTIILDESDCELEYYREDYD